MASANSMSSRGDLELGLTPKSQASRIIEEKVLDSRAGLRTVQFVETTSTRSSADTVSQTSRRQRFSLAVKEAAAECLGTFILVYFGTGANAQAILTGGAGGNWVTICFGWGVGVLLATLIVGPISGAHINPAVTIALATYRHFPWHKVPHYVFGQTLGAFFAGCVVQANYYGLVNRFEGGNGVRTFGLATSSAGVFFTRAQPWVSNIGAFWDEVIGTGFIMMGVLAISDMDKHSGADSTKTPESVRAGMKALLLMWIIIGIGASNGIQTSFCLNPARDVGARIAGSIYGYPSTIWTDRYGYAIWCCVLGPVIGTLLGGLIHDLVTCARKGRRRST